MLSGGGRTPRGCYEFAVTDGQIGYDTRNLRDRQAAEHDQEARMCPKIATEAVSESTHVRDYLRPIWKQGGSIAPAPTYGTVRDVIPRFAAALASQDIAEEATQTRLQRRTYKPRLWSTQRWALQLVAIDLAMALCSWMYAVSRASIETPAEVSFLPLWLIVWVASTSVAGGFSSFAGFSSRRQIATSMKLSFRSGTIALAACSIIAFFSGIGLKESNFLEVIIGLTLISGLARIMLTLVSPAKIIVVTREHESMPVDYASGSAVLHLQLTDSQIADPKVLIAEISETSKYFDACAVEIVGDFGVPETTWRTLIWALREQRVSLRFPIEGGALRQHRVHCAVRGGRAVLEISAPVRPLAMRLAKRTTDVVGALGLIIAVLPILVLVGCAVKMTSRGSVLYRQERVGCDGRSFQILKFRTMADGSDALLQSLLKAQNRGDTPLFKVADDPRITPLGAFLRRFSLDELPQLFNVLGGSMSLVGPRPQRPAEVALYSGDADHRLGVRPGMTGLWQVSGRSRLSWEEGQQMDIDYAHNWSIWEDLHILARTARAVVASDGAV